MNFTERKPAKGEKKENIKPQESFIIDVLLQVASDASLGPRTNNELPPGIRPPQPGERGRMEVVPVILSCVDSIGLIRIIMPQDLHSPEQRIKVSKNLEEVKTPFPGRDCCS